MTRRWLLPFLLIILLLGSLWFLERLSVDTVKREGSMQQQESDYVIDDFTTTSMDKTGWPQYRLDAKRMVHYPDTDTSELEKPYLIFFNAKIHDKSIHDGSKRIPLDHEKISPDYPAWHAESEQGRILGNGKVIFLLGKVHLWKNNNTGTMEIDMRTRDLRILPDLSYGETDEMIIIRTATSETRSIGMRTHIRPSRVELLSGVETIYQKIQR